MRYSGSLTKLSSRGGTHQSAMEPESTDIECEMVSSFELLNGDPTATVDRLPRRVSSLHLEMVRIFYVIWALVRFRVSSIYATNVFLVGAWLPVLVR
jgi:hypothetical protein